MNRYYLMIFCILPALSISIAQNCNRTDASGCYCDDSLSKKCDLLPDLTISLYSITNPNYGFIEYPQMLAGTNYSGQGNDDGRFRVTIGTANIGYGPLHIIGTDTFVCGIDTFRTINPDTFICDDGKIPSRLIVQRIYHKNQNMMQYNNRVAGTMTYHPFHGHMHVDDWVIFSLRIKKNNEPDPLKWPIIGKANKMGYCLFDASNCTELNGYCKDQNDSILVTQKIKNSTLGYYALCTDKEQGITSGYLDIYASNMYGMWIDVPPGTCNGTYYLVVAVDPYNHFVESTKKNNLLVVPIELKNQDSSLKTRVIQVTQSLDICNNQNIKLNAIGAISYKWSTQDTVQNISVNKTGTYKVDVTLPCGKNLSDSIKINVFDPPVSPVVKNDTVCIGDSAKLISENGEIVYWYNSPSSNQLIHSGSYFNTPPLFASREYYAESKKSLPEKIYHVGKVDTNGQGTYFPEGEYISFDCLTHLFIDSITVFVDSLSQDTVPFNIQLRNQYQSVLERKWFTLTVGKNVLPLGFGIPIGEGYQLFFPNRGGRLFCNTGEFYYPLDIPGVLSIKNSSQGKTVYLYYYNWVIRASGLSCTNRVPVSVVVDSGCTVGLNQRKVNNLFYRSIAYPNPFHDATTIQISGIELNEKYTLQLFDHTGRQIGIQANQGNKFIIEKNNLASGFYIYQIHLQNNLIAIGKLMRQ